MKLNPYIMFNGNAEEALNFYHDCFGGEIRGINRYGDAPMPSPEESKNKILHSTFVFDDNTIMISDSMDSKNVPESSNIHLSVDVPGVDEMDVKFNKLAEGGKVTMPLQDTFWGARFGMLTDKFGVNWMFNCELKK
jgi:PhnB protein